MTNKLNTEQSQTQSQQTQPQQQQQQQQQQQPQPQPQQQPQQTICPICNTSILYFQRYPKYLCQNCVRLAVDSDNNAVKFGNVNESGGFISIHMVGEQKIKREDHKCWVKGIECVASEAKFGGIVVQTVNKVDK